MTFWFLVALGIAWIAVFVPAAIRAKGSAPISSTERFKRGLEVMAPRDAAGRGRWVVVPSSPDGLRSVAFRRSQRRRQRILKVLLGATLAAAALAVPGFLTWDLVVASFTTLAFYVVLLLGTKRQRRDQASKVRSLRPSRRESDERVIFNEPAQASGG